MAKSEIVYVTVPKQLFVGVKDSNLDKAKFPLAFATPYDKEDAPFLKRKASVENWCSGYYGSKEKNLSTYHYLDNVPTEGYRIAGYTSRYSTSNKFIEIYDPRGFCFEISVKNMFDIMLLGEIKNGVILGKYVFGRDGSVNVLLHETHEAVKASQAVSKTLGELKFGDIIVAQKQKRIYLGQKYIADIYSNYKHDYVYLEKLDDAFDKSKWIIKEYRDRNWFKRSTDQPIDFSKLKECYKKTWNYTLSKTDKQHIFLMLDDDIEKSTKLVAAKTCKIQAWLGNSGIKDFNFLERKNNLHYNTESYFFDTKEEMDAFDLEASQIMIKKPAITISHRDRESGSYKEVLLAEIPW
jgi:hypothetical protein